MAKSDKTFEVGGKTFRLNVKEDKFHYGGKLVSTGDFCTNKEFEKAREAASTNSLLCSEVVKASDDLEAENKKLKAENAKLTAEVKKLKGGK